VPASVNIVSWPVSGPVRVALLAPVSRLVWLSAAAIAVTLAVVVQAFRPAIARSVVRTFRSAPQAGVTACTTTDGYAARRIIHVLQPLQLLWLWLVPYLPWIPDRAPLLLVLAGPLRWVIAGIAVVAVLRRATRDTKTGPENAKTRRFYDRVGRRGVFLISLAVYLVFGLYAVETNGLGGDEPHYLIITESLLKDGDLQIENNHRQGDYRSFFDGELRPDYLQRGKNGQRGGP
jgi:hypothetical protein